MMLRHVRGRGVLSGVYAGVFFFDLQPSTILRVGATVLLAPLSQTVPSIWFRPLQTKINIAMQL